MDKNKKDSITCPCFTATPIAKSHHPTLKAKLVKECICPNERGTAKLIDKLKINKGQLVFWNSLIKSIFDNLTNLFNIKNCSIEILSI